MKLLIATVGVASTLLLTACEKVPASIRVAPSAVYLAGANATQSLSATGVSASGEEIPIRVTWLSSDPKVATVDASGTVTARESGEATIRCTYVRRGFQRALGAIGRSSAPTSGQAAIRVEIASALKLDVDKLVLGYADRPRRLTATVVDEKGQPLSRQPPVVFSSAEPTIASVGQTDGLVDWSGPGHTVVTASSGPLHAEAQVEVDARPRALVWDLGETTTIPSLLETLMEFSEGYPRLMDAGDAPGLPEKKSLVLGVCGSKTSLPTIAEAVRRLSAGAAFPAFDTPAPVEEGSCPRLKGLFDSSTGHPLVFDPDWRRPAVEATGKEGTLTAFPFWRKDSDEGGEGRDYEEQALLVTLRDQRNGLLDASLLRSASDFAKLNGLEASGDGITWTETYADQPCNGGDTHRVSLIQSTVKISSSHGKIKTKETHKVVKRDRCEMSQEGGGG
jgi:hypothetical protein